MKQLSATLAFFVCVLGTSNAQAAPCTKCEALKAIVAQVRGEAEKPSPEYPALIAKASKVCEGMTKIKGDELAAYIEALRALTAVDAGHAFIENTIDVIQKNRAAIDAALSQLPKAEAKSLAQAVQMAVDSEEHGPDND